MYTPAECHLIAARYDTKGEWMAGHPNSYKASKRLGVYASCTAHMRQGNQKWTIETCMKDSAKYRTKTAWKEGNHSSYRAARKNGWFEACTAHMDNPKIKFTLDVVLSRASKYKSWTEWKREDRSTYIAAQKNGWLNEVAEVLERPTTNPNHFVKWSKEMVIQEAKRFNNKTRWARESSSSYCAAKTLDVFEEASRHMSDPRIRN